MEVKMIKIVNNVEESNAITHGGTFHADEIFSTIFLSKFQEIFLYRMNEFQKKSIKDQIVFDIGCGEFDHHGQNAKIRENGIKYSSFGLLFEKYGRDYLKKKHVEEIEEAYQMFLNELVLQIDAIDNGIFPKNPEEYNILNLSQIIEQFNLTWKEEKNEKQAFLEALQLAELIFNRIEKRIIDKLSAKEIVKNQIEKVKEPIIIFDQHLPYMDYVLASESEPALNLVFAILPSNRGGYNIQTIKKSSKSNLNRLDFPKEWGGKTKEELFQLTKIKSFRFCHPNLFLCACDTLEDAKKIARLAITIKNKKN